MLKYRQGSPKTTTSLSSVRVEIFDCENEINYRVANKLVITMFNFDFKLTIYTFIFVIRNIFMGFICSIYQVILIHLYYFCSLSSIFSRINHFLKD